MKVYKIKVNGKAYEVEVEAVSESQGHVEAAPKAAQASAGEQTIKAPMAGNIISVKVNVGDQVKVGDKVLVLEAMKLENDVVSQVAGKVKAVNVSKGSVVKAGDVMIIVE